ncbi:MAG: hypothetical protein WAN30_06355 [Acidimicrobiales bacterium]
MTNGLPVTRPSRFVPDLLSEHEDPEAVGQIISESIRKVFDYPGTFADALTPYATRFGLRRNDGLGLLRWLLSLTDDPDADRWINEAVAHSGRVTEGKEPIKKASGTTRPRARVEA